MKSRKWASSLAFYISQWLPSGKRLQFANLKMAQSKYWIFPWNMVIFHRFFLCLPVVSILQRHGEKSLGAAAPGSTPKWSCRKWQSSEASGRRVQDDMAWTAVKIHILNTWLQPPFGQSVDSLCHPWFTTTNLSYRFPIFETSATALCGTAGI